MLTGKPFCETEEHIFRAAIHEFAMNGKNGARLQAIADAAGVNKALVHYYFRSKEHLYESVFDFMFNNFITALKNGMKDTKTFSELLQSFINNYIDFLTEYEGYPILLQQELGFGAGTWRKKYTEIVRKFDKPPSKYFTDKMQEAIDRGEIRDVDPMQTFISLMGACIYLFVGFPIISSARPELYDNMKELIEIRKKHIYDLLFNGLKNKENE